MPIVLSGWASSGTVVKWCGDLLQDLLYSLLAAPAWDFMGNVSEDIRTSSCLTELFPLGRFQSRLFPASLSYMQMSSFLPFPLPPAERQPPPLSSLGKKPGCSSWICWTLDLSGVTYFRCRIVTVLRSNSYRFNDLGGLQWSVVGGGRGKGMLN